MKIPLIFLLVLSISFISAWPLQLLNNGSIIDLGTNETINGTSVDFVYANDTLFLIPKVNIVSYNITNYTIFNVTNLTQIDNITYMNITGGNFTNVTYQNLTLQNITCVNCTYNTTGINSSILDSRLGSYILTSTANGQYALKSELPNLALYTLKTELNESISQEDKTNTLPLWIGIIIAAVLSIIAILMARGASE